MPNKSNHRGRPPVGFRFLHLRRAVRVGTQNFIVVPKKAALAIHDAHYGDGLTLFECQTRFGLSHSGLVRLLKNVSLWLEEHSVPKLESEPPEPPGLRLSRLRSVDELIKEIASKNPKPTLKDVVKAVRVSNATLRKYYKTGRLSKTSTKFLARFWSRSIDDAEEP